MKIEQLPAHSRVWIYQANRMLLPNEEELIHKLMSAFVTQWAAHGKALNAAYTVEKGMFLILAVDEAQAAASGCSIDSSVAVVKQLEQELGVDFFNRQLVAHLKGEEIQLTPLHDFWAMRKAGVINDETIVFNNLVKNLAEFNDSWILPFGKSWHAEMFR